MVRLGFFQWQQVANSYLACLMTDDGFADVIVSRSSVFPRRATSFNIGLPRAETLPLSILQLQSTSGPNKGRVFDVKSC